MDSGVHLCEIGKLIMIKHIANQMRNNSLFQVLLVCLIWLACELLARLYKFPVPGGILGLGLVLFLLLTKTLNLETVKGGAQLLLKEMLLFFIPAVLAVLEHREFLGLLGLKVLMVIILSTITVMLITALVVDCSYSWRIKHFKSTI